ncbi:MAG: pyridoxine/pyridoxal/pyridoxamine kinase [Burkholderiaceae bacterium]
MLATTQQPLMHDVVSVQSQVVYGRVGNNVARPTLEAMGLRVAAVPTVVLSNTPHYPTMHGGAIPTKWFSGYLADLSARGALHQLKAVLVGYLGSPAQAAALARWVQQLLAQYPKLRVVIDPVMGDHDSGIYVDPRMAQAYRQRLMPLAQVLTPNGFELAHLTGQPVDDVDSVIAAARSLLSGHTECVAVTSGAPDTWPVGAMQVVLVTRAQAQVITHALVDASPKGTGDLFAAALTGHWISGDSLPQAAMKACQQVVRALRLTREAQSAELLLPTPATPMALEPVSIRDVNG